MAQWNKLCASTGLVVTKKVTTGRNIICNTTDPATGLEVMIIVTDRVKGVEICK